MASTPWTSSFFHRLVDPHLLTRTRARSPVHLSTVMMHSVPASSESTQLARADSPPLYTIFDTPRSPPL